MKPHVIMHMGISIDGRIVPGGWPEEVGASLNKIYEDVHSTLDGDAWIVGRVTMSEFGKGEPRPIKASEVYPRTTWKAKDAETGPYGIAIDQGGKLHLNTDRANGDPIVLILVESVSDDHLGELQRDGISYLFAGKDKLDLALALERLHSDFGVERLLLEGGGGINGSFFSDDLVDEVSLLVAPFADGNEGPTLLTGGRPKGTKLRLTGVQDIDGGHVHLRYDVIR